MTTHWYDDMSELDEPVEDVLSAMQARTDAALARLRDDRGPLIAINHAAADAWLDSYRADEARDFDPREA